MRDVSGSAPTTRTPAPTPTPTPTVAPARSTPKPSPSAPAAEPQPAQDARAGESKLGPGDLKVDHVPPRAESIYGDDHREPSNPDPVPDHPPNVATHERPRASRRGDDGPQVRYGDEHREPARRDSSGPPVGTDEPPRGGELQAMLEALSDDMHLSNIDEEPAGPVANYSEDGTIRLDEELLRQRRRSIDAIQRWWSIDDQA